MEVIQKELDIVRMDWNEHRVRYQDDNVPCGKPEMLYKHPELYGKYYFLLICVSCMIEKYF